jgi:hypothetical protein
VLHLLLLTFFCHSTLCAFFYSHISFLKKREIKLEIFNPGKRFETEKLVFLQHQEHGNEKAAQCVGLDVG